MELGEGLKKILLVGIGTAAVTADTSPLIKTTSCPPHLPFQVRKDTSAVLSIWSMTETQHQINS